MPVYQSKLTEKGVLLDIASTILLPLCSEVVLEKRYKAELAKMPRPPELSCADIGLGSVDTWHGTPDLRVRGVEFLNRKVTEEAADSVESGEEMESEAEEREKGGEIDEAEEREEGGESEASSVSIDDNSANIEGN